MSAAPENRILLCQTCQSARANAEARQVLNAALLDAGLADQFAVTDVDSLGGCARPNCLGFQGAGRATYVFHDVQVSRDVADIAEFCALYLRSDAGWIVDARPLGDLRFKLRARIPFSAN